MQDSGFCKARRCHGLHDVCLGIVQEDKDVKTVYTWGRKLVNWEVAVASDPEPHVPIASKHPVDTQRYLSLQSTPQTMRL